VDYPLEGDPVQRRVFDHQSAEDVNADVHQVRHGVVSRLELVDPVREELECRLRERVDEQGVRRAEQGIDGARRGAGLAGDGPHGERGGTSLGHETLGGVAQSNPCVLVVLPRPAQGLTS